MIALILWLCSQDKVVHVADVTALRVAVRNAQPGAEIVIAPGRYSGHVFFENVRGTAERRLVVRGQDPNNPPVFTSWHVSGAAHLTLRDLRFQGAEGNGLNLDDGGTPGGAHHITLERIHVSDLPPGNHDGIKLSGVDDFRIIDCTVERWGGSGIDMVGCHRGVVSGCTFRQGGDNGVQAKGGSSDIRIERCRFEDPGHRGVNLGGSTGRPYFRPADATWEARNLTVEGCTFVGGTAAVAFVGVDGALVRYNTIYRPTRWALRILQETTEPTFVRCRDGRFERNLIVFSQTWASGGVNLGPNTAPETFRFAENFWFCLDAPERSRPTLPTQERSGVYGINPLLLDPERGNLGVQPGSPARAYGAHAWPGSSTHSSGNNGARKS